ncbi:glycosyltransferase [Thalassococcus sp. CAU 1522]|uniref:Glycosyltransferase n=1 Tax=Thalassococcus arenae TaxID=2851652 RepID=A0ABS6N6I1_9RHOB|nr:glycosyltransferase [Thalassococcus arenae]MBV2359629.1 glycosyltransferase [Thalassococcus arenae]
MAPPVSVVIVSRGRPAALQRCLTAVAQLDYPEFEVVVVACEAGRAAVAARDDAAAIKLAACDVANISAARNIGVAEASGDIVAFIDDDAVPEPLWLSHLAGAFADPQVAAAGGFVLGRNGISFQWRGRMVDGNGRTTDVELDPAEPTVLHGQPGLAVKTEGTNMAVRRDVLAAIGGFDPAFHYYLDETDLNLRLAKAGRATALVPLAQVHHGFAESPQRAADRSPRDLFEIGASVAAFLERHCGKGARKVALAKHRAEQRMRCLRAMQRGPLGADDVARLMRRFRKGVRDGLTRVPAPLPPIPQATQPFRPYPGRPEAPRRVIAGRVWQATRKRAEAAQAARDGAIVSLYLFSPTARRHRVRFTEDGVWEQTGGLLGRSDRTDPPLRLTTFARRLRREIARTAPVRQAQGPDGDQM